MADQVRESEDQENHRGVVKIFGKNHSDEPKRLIFASKRETQLTSPSPVAEVPEPIESQASVMEANASDKEVNVVAENWERIEVVEGDQWEEASDLEDLIEEKEELPEELEAVFHQEEPSERLKMEHPLEAKVRELAQLAYSITAIPDEEWEDMETGDDWLLLDGEPSRDIAMLLDEKVREFRFLGYEHIAAEQIWSYFQHLRKRRPRNLHELVNAILSLQPQAVMNYDLQVAYRHLDESLEDILNDLK